MICICVCVPLLIFCVQILEDEVTASRPTLHEASWGLRVFDNDKKGDSYPQNS